MNKVNGVHTSLRGQSDDPKRHAEQQQDEEELLATGKLRSADLTVSFFKAPSAGTTSQNGPQSPFEDVKLEGPDETWWGANEQLHLQRMQEQEKQRAAQLQHTRAWAEAQGGGPERADSKVLSDEEVEEAEASDSFPALGYPAGIGSIGSGDFSEMMRRQGATGDDWSDWDAHLPASPPGSTGLPEALSSLSLSRSLSKQTSDKFEVAEGEDEDLKRMMWVVENLQEELLTADEARMAADQHVQARSKVVQGLQLEVQDRVGKMADLDEQLAEMHKRLEKQLLQQLDTQELLRKHEEDVRDTQAETAHINQVIMEKDAEMAELKRQAAQGRPPAAAPSSSARGAASSSQKHDSTGRADDDSPKSNMSSPWGTDVSGSDDDEEDEERKQRKRTPTSTRLSDVAGRRPGSASPSSAQEAGRAPHSGTSSQLGTGPAMYYSKGTWLRSVLGGPQKSGEAASPKAASSKAPSSKSTAPNKIPSSSKRPPSEPVTSREAGGSSGAAQS